MRTSDGQALVDDLAQAAAYRAAPNGSVEGGQLQVQLLQKAQAALEGRVCGAE